jgi:hypothetical protein
MTTRVLSVRRHFHSDSAASNGIAGHIGRPAVGDAVDAAINVSGWCASPARALVRLVAYAAGARTDIEINMPSADVAAAQPGLVGGAACRFQGVVNVPPSPRAQLIQLCVEDKRGQISPFGEILVSPPLPAATDSLDGPVFVVGSPRSGTTILGNTIRYSLGLTGFDEAQFLPLLTHLSNAAKRFYEIPHYTQMRQTKGTVIAQVPVTVIESGLAQMFRELYAALHGNAEFVDKTPGPGMLRAIPGLLLAWPNARFVFATRRAIENLISRQRKFGFSAENFKLHCNDWAEAMNLWLKHRGAIPESQRIEIDQMDIVRDHQAVAETLAVFCGVPGRARDFADYIANNTPQKTTSDDWKVLDLAETNWDQDSVGIFHEICGPMMSAWGYTTDASYRKVGPAGGAIVEAAKH